MPTGRPSRSQHPADNAARWRILARYTATLIRQPEHQSKQPRARRLFAVKCLRLDVPEARPDLPEARPEDAQMGSTVQPHLPPLLPPCLLPKLQLLEGTPRNNARSRWPRLEPTSHAHLRWFVRPLKTA